VYSQESLFPEDDYNRSSVDFNNNESNLGGKTKRTRDSARIILLHTEKVDKLYPYMQQDEYVSKSIIFENKPTNAARRERVFLFANQIAINYHLHSNCGKRNK
jgi:hypothetical protein